MLKGKKDKKIIYKKRIQKYEQTNNLTQNDFIYYGQYKTTDKNIKRLLNQLTNGKFKFGSISQKIIKQHWLENKRITYKKFAQLWLNEFNNNKTYDELAYNNFMKQYGDKNKWKDFKHNIIVNFKKLIK